MFDVKLYNFKSYNVSFFVGKGYEYFFFILNIMELSKCIFNDVIIIFMNILLGILE